MGMFMTVTGRDGLNFQVAHIKGTALGVKFQSQQTCHAWIDILSANWSRCFSDPRVLWLPGFHCSTDG